MMLERSRRGSAWVGWGKSRARAVAVWREWSATGRTSVRGCGDSTSTRWVGVGRVDAMWSSKAGSRRLKVRWSGVVTVTVPSGARWGW